MSQNGARTLRLEIASAVEMLDLVQLVTDHVGHAAGLDDDSVHWFGMAVRECVTNAIIHGNGSPSSAVSIEFTTRPAAKPSELAVCVRDQGPGFDPSRLPDPLAPENILRTSGRGIYLMRQFMDDVSIERTSTGGTEVRMVKRIRPGESEAKLR
jgi:serine/threonine-protein kinase RsbW